MAQVPRVVAASALAAGIVVASCASPEGSVDVAGLDSTTSTSVPPSSLAPTTTKAPAATSTTLTPTTSSATTTVARQIDPDAAAWIDVEFEVATDHPRAKGDEILANVGTLNVEILTDGEPAGVHPWFVGFTAYARGVKIDLLIVGEEPNVYSPPEYAMSEQGIEPEEPNPSVTHQLTVWAIAKSATSLSAYRITDAITIELPATLLGRYGSFLSVAQEPWLCDIDPSLESLKLYGFFDDTGDDLEIDTHYPAVLALGVDNGIISTPPTDMVQCILRLHPENY